MHSEVGVKCRARLFVEERDCRIRSLIMERKATLLSLDDGKYEFNVEESSYSHVHMKLDRVGECLLCLIYLW